MADFRRWILALAVLAIVFGTEAPARAQGNSVNCTASASVIPTLRREGLNELTGDIVLTCVGATGAMPVTTGNVPQANVTVNLSALFTSRILSGTANTGATNVNYDITEALLLVDDPSPTNQHVCGSPTNGALCADPATGGASYNTPNTKVYNVFQGVTVPGTPSTEVTFLGVPIDPPGTGVPVRTYRVTNIRVNATAVANTALVYGYIASSSSTSMEINQPQQAIGVVNNGLTATVGSTNSPFLQCLTYPITQVGSVTFTEDFATAFKVAGGVQNTPGVVYNSESGLEISTSYGETGIADTGTRLQVVISNIPLGVTVLVDPWMQSTGAALTAVPPVPSDATLVTGSGTPVDPCPAGLGSCGSFTNAPVAITDGTETTATAVWEITETNPFAVDSLVFGIYATFVGEPGSPGSPTPNNGANFLQVTGAPSFSPLVTALSSSNGPIPAFLMGVNTQPTGNIFTVNLCQTILLFPYVTDFYGFDTGIAISNTSEDPLGAGIGASPQTGTCAVNFYGTGASNLGSSGVYSSLTDTALTNGDIPAGTTWTFALSTIDPGYNSTATYGLVGYAIAVCNFQYAHGYSFVSDTGIRNFAAAYLALIIPDAPRAPQPFTCSENGGYCASETGEQLVH